MQFINDEPVAGFRGEASNDLLTCIHESAHVVAATSFGVRISRVTVEDQPRLFCGDEFPINDMSIVAVTAFAGIEAERVVDPGASEKGASIDFALAREVYAQYFHDQDEAAFMARSRQQARALARRLWIPIQWIAARLYLDGEVAGDTVRQILADGVERKARERDARLNRAWQNALAQCGH